MWTAFLGGASWFGLGGVTQNFRWQPPFAAKYDGVAVMIINK